MKHLLKNSLLMAIGFLSFACSKDSNEPYGPDYEITDIKADVFDEAYYNDTIPADVFKVRLSLMSDNEYAQKYGLNPKLKTRITDLVINLDNYEELSSFTDKDVSKYFLVEDGYSSNNLYETIVQYTHKKELNSLSPGLVFTNQVSLSPNADKLITDTVAIELSIMFTLDTKKTFSKQIKTVLKP